MFVSHKANTPPVGLPASAIKFGAQYNRSFFPPTGPVPPFDLSYSGAWHVEGVLGPLIVHRIRIAARYNGKTRGCFREPPAAKRLKWEQRTGAVSCATRKRNHTRQAYMPRYHLGSYLWNDDISMKKRRGPAKSFPAHRSSLIMRQRLKPGDLPGLPHRATRPGPSFILNPFSLHPPSFESLVARA